MLHSLVLPVYNNLLFLTIKKSKLQNIEFLSYLNAEYVIKLNLVSNEITYIKPMNKLKWKNLGFLSFCDNPISQIDFSRVKTHLEFKKLKLEEKADNKVVENDVSFLSKVDAVESLNQKRTNLFMTVEGRIPQTKLIETLEKKNIRFFRFI